jgi:signal transduction histidine kinase
MSRYDQLRQYFALPREQRVAMLRTEMLGDAKRADMLGRQLVGAGNARTQLALAPRAQELAEIIAESSADLARSVAALPDDGLAVDDEDKLRRIRHDLRGKLSTLLGATGLLQRLLGQDGASQEVLTIVSQLQAAADQMRDVLQALTDERGRE